MTFIKYFHSKYIHRVLALILCFCLLSSFHSSLLVPHAETQTGTVNASSLNLREQPSTSSAIKKALPNGTTVTITSTVTDTSGDSWYLISVEIDQASYTGYVFASYITITQSSNPTTQVTTQATTQATTTTSSVTESTESVKPAGTPSGSQFAYANVKKKTYLYKSRSTKSKKVEKLKKNTLVYAGQKKKIGGKTWYYVTKHGSKSKKSGYILGIKLKFQPTTVKKNTRYKLCLTNKQCNVYKTANGTKGKIGTVEKMQDVIMRATLKVGGQEWAKIDTSKGTGYVPYSWLIPTVSTVKSTLKIEGTVAKKSYTRKIASLRASNKGTASKGKKVTVLGRITINGVSWYKVSFKKSGKTITGYIRAQYVVLSSDNADFETLLSEFPASYHTAIRNLHTLHPNWVFKAINTNLAWKTVIQNESVSGRNTIQSNCPKGGVSSAYSAPFSYLSTAAGDYNWGTDTYTLRDGTNWYTANSQVISYYMDPRNFLNETDIFQFEALTFEPTQTDTVVTTMLKNTFMSGNYSVTDIATKKKASGSYTTAFMDAAESADVSPYYLVSRVKNEVGTQGSGSTSGTYSGYKGYYNFYNIGANDSASGQAVANGLSWAKSGTTYNRPWTTPYKSIVGGAQYIAEQYIGKGQNTMYTQKFNVVVPTSLYMHQYMTAVTATKAYSLSNYNTYKNNSLLNDAYTFFIPTYTSMPDAPCALPASTGNPNGYLKSLSVKNTANGKAVSLNATFNYATKTYSATVASTVDKITVSATTISARAKVGGTGTIALSKGKTKTITVTGTAENGTVQTYTIDVTRKAS